MALRNKLSKNQKIVPRGLKVMLPHGGLPEVISPYLIDLIEKTGGKNGPIGKQFVAQPEKEKKYYSKNFLDPLCEDENEVVPGIVYKYRGKIKKNGKVEYYGRVLWITTRFCGSYCRFCTRGREIGMPQNFKTETRSALTKKPLLTNQEIEKVFKFLKKRKEINEVILSGGDPLVSPKDYLTKIVNGLVKLQKSGDLDIIRIGTRLPIHNPSVVKRWHYELLGKIRNPFLMVHINHPAELTDSVLKVINNFKEISGASVFSQTVLLKGVNDSVETLYELFVKMTKEGIRPYYLYQNDPVYWAKHFTVPIKKAIKMWQKLRPRLSGVAATARFVIDTPSGAGKVPIPEGGAWNVDYSAFYDFQKKKHNL
ncbi:MAG: radical SAM protein [Candidatus Omnitrophica bacterium]|nr:radical SAM protein [Candidatus Omnitrophota bacterium]